MGKMATTSLISLYAGVSVSCAESSILLVQVKYYILHFAVFYVDKKEWQSMCALCIMLLSEFVLSCGFRALREVVGIQETTVDYLQVETSAGESLSDHYMYLGLMTLLQGWKYNM